MSDHLKEYIQKSRQDFDNEIPRPELFGEIMNRLDSRPSVRENRFISFRSYKLAIAASILTTVLLFVAYLSFFKNENPVLVQVPVKTPLNYDEKTIPIKPSEMPANQDESGRAAMIVANPETPLPNTFKRQVPKPVFISEPAISYEVHDTINEHSFVTEENKKPSTNEQELSSVKAGPGEEPQPAISDASESKMTTTQPEVRSEEKDALVLAAPELKSGEERKAPEARSVGSFLKRSVLRFLSKKTKEWTSNAIDLQTGENDQATALAVNVKTELVEFSKTIHLRTNDH